jgi:hypothetical protein
VRIAQDTSMLVRAARRLWFHGGLRPLYCNLPLKSYSTGKSDFDFLASLQKQTQETIQQLQQREQEQRALDQQKKEQQKKAEEEELKQKRQRDEEMISKMEEMSADVHQNPNSFENLTMHSSDNVPSPKKDYREPEIKEWRHSGRALPEKLLDLIKEKTGITMYQERRGRGIDLIMQGELRQLIPAQSIIRKYMARNPKGPLIRKLFPTNNELVRLVDYKGEYTALELVERKEGEKDQYPEHNIEEFFEGLLSHLADFRGEILILGRFGKNVFLGDFPNRGPFPSEEVFSSPHMNSRSSFIPQVDSAGRFAALPGGQASESMDVRLLIKTGATRWESIILRLSVIDGKLHPFRAYLGCYRNAVDQVSLYTNSDIRLSLHTYPILPDDHFLFPRINEFFNSLKFSTTPNGFTLHVHPSPDFFVYHVRYKRKNAFVYKSRYNIDLNQVHSYSNDGFDAESHLALGEPQTEIEISDMQWTEKFEYNLPGSEQPPWAPQEIVADLSEFITTVRALSLLVTHKG